ncbi:MAG: TspO/MBR family protein [Acidobacteriota bacterium]
MTSSTRQWLGLIGFVAVCFLAAGIGSHLTTSSLDGWYAGLQKPPWNPPNWVFAPVWSALFLSMAIAAWLVWRKLGWRGAAIPLALFVVQLVLNVTWSGLFFALHLPGAAFAELVVLWGAILATMIYFWRVTPAAGWLMAPYLAWVTFAGVLNWTLARMNS